MTRQDLSHAGARVSPRAVLDVVVFDREPSVEFRRLRRPSRPTRARRRRLEHRDRMAEVTGEAAERERAAAKTLGASIAERLRFELAANRARRT